MLDYNLFEIKDLFHNSLVFDSLFAIPILRQSKAMSDKVLLTPNPANLPFKSISLDRSELSNSLTSPFVFFFEFVII